MRRVLVTLSVFALLLLTVMPAANAGNAELAAGGGTYTTSTGAELGVELAGVSNPGGIHGSMEVYFVSTGNQWLSADVDCVYVDGNIAFVSGPLDNNPAVTLVIAVEDNGRSATDRVSVSTGNVACDHEPTHSIWLGWLVDMDTGNIVVK